MSLVINTNVMSLNAQRNVAQTQQGLMQSIQRLSSGLRINSAKDDAAGLAIAETLTSKVRGNSVAARNANDGISLGQTAESALGQVANNLQRIREIAVQAANVGQDDDRELLQKEVDELQAEIVRLVDSTEFNGLMLLDGSETTALTFQIGSDNEATHQLELDLSTTDLTSLGAYAAADVSTQAAAQALLDTLDTDITTVTEARSVFGAVQNRFEVVVANLGAYNEALSAARSRIMDADFAVETAQLTRNQIMQQSGIAMLAQANAAPQAVLGLLG